MSYSVSGSGHGVDPEKAKEAFTEFVKALDEATDEQSGSKFAGSISGNDGGGTGFNLSAAQVREEEAS
jgi:hypothetical protein